MNTGEIQSLRRVNKLFKKTKQKNMEGSSRGEKRVVGIVWAQSGRDYAVGIGGVV